MIDKASGPARVEKFTGAIVDLCMGPSLFPEQGTFRDDLRPSLRIVGRRRRVSIALMAETDDVVLLGIFCGG